MSQDHPRVCGEKFCAIRPQVVQAGSPPRVRGKVNKFNEPLRRGGITPACAGKSGSPGVIGECVGDHPRVCGEKERHLFPVSTWWGSPPRVRGKAIPFTVTEAVAGITPACAGKRLKRSHSIGHFSCILCLFHSVLHRASVSGGSRAGPCAPPCLPAQNAVPV